MARIPKLKFYLTLAASAVIFWFDIRSPLSVADWLLYPVLLVYVFYTLTKKQSMFLMSLSTVFIIVGLLISPRDISLTVAVADRALAIGSSWAAFFLVWKGRERDRMLKELREAREALARSEQHYHTLHDTMLQGVIYRDAEGKVISMNPAARRILGTSAAEFNGEPRGLNELDLIKEDGSPLPAEEHPFMVVRRTGREMTNTIVGIYNPVEKARRWINVSTVPLFKDGEKTPYQIYTLFDDITERKRADDQINELNKALTRKIQEIETVFNAAPMGLAIAHDADCARIDGNPYFIRILGLNPGQNTSKSAPEEERPDFKVMREGRELSPEELPMQMAAKRGLWVENTDMEIMRRDGSTMKLIGNAAPLFDEYGKPRGAVGAFMDITELKIAEERLKESLKEKEVLLRELYHRTKNNITAISGLLSLQMTSINDPAIRRIFEEAQGRIQSMSLVHEMLYKTNELSELDLKSYLEELAGRIMASNKELASNIKLVLDMETAPVSIDAAVPCGLIVNELLSNGIKHAFPGSRAGEITLSLRKSGGEIEMSYSDNGVGMPDGFRIQDAKSLGLRLVDNLSRKQLLGSLEILSAGGTKIAIRFNPARLEEKSRPE